MTPEFKARQEIDRLLTAAGWHVCDMLQANIHAARGVAVRDGEHYRFAQDYVFPAPSTAAAVVLGRSANGRVEWKDAGGRTLKELQEREAAA